jgi:hypothetical protein
VRIGQRLRRWFQPKAEPTTQPEWLYHPAVAIGALVATIAAAVTPLIELVVVIQGGLGLLTYDDRRSRRLPWFWWPTGVASLGPIAYIVYVFRRDDHLRERDRPPAPAVVGWQYVQAGPQWAPPAWYADPWRQARLRYWDGVRWTPYVSW